MKNKCIVLLSGGMDSAVALAMAKQEYSEVIAVNLVYGQRHVVEIVSARELAEYYDVEYVQIDISSAFSNINSSLLLHSNIDIDDTQDKSSIGATFVPGRNIIFLAVAAGIADSMEVPYIMYGAHADDHTGYADCRPEFYFAMNRAVGEGTKTGVQIIAPFINMSKGMIAHMGTQLKVPLEKTHSCYRGVKYGCGTCPTCVLRQQAFDDAGLIDPIVALRGTLCC